MKTVCIVVGHKATSGGAVNSLTQLSEYDYNNPVASLLAELLHRQNVRPVILYRDSYTQLPQDVNRIKPDYCIELHCNAAVNLSAQGAEMLYWHTSSRSKALAKRIQTAVAGLFGEADRGIKPITDGQNGAHLLKGTSMPCVIAEPFFISNSESLAKALVLREQYANVLAGAIVGHIRQELTA